MEEIQRSGVHEQQQAAIRRRMQVEGASKRGDRDYRSWGQFR